ncbi:unnamed protein product [Rangifer tarandus platyrhynchus]|uniref:Uncharacterized protein n=2 Tax=Rangifer tarandus platyrhynchus TaxID=3082113 RepID=A0ABN8ZT59_RANTA|nr:unnamed protein product [Rangifer tarandus platyrhynchus]
MVGGGCLTAREVASSLTGAPSLASPKASPGFWGRWYRNKEKRLWDAGLGSRGSPSVGPGDASKQKSAGRCPLHAPRSRAKLQTRGVSVPLEGTPACRSCQPPPRWNAAPWHFQPWLPVTPEFLQESRRPGKEDVRPQRVLPVPTVQLEGPHELETMQRLPVNTAEHVPVRLRGKHSAGPRALAQAWRVSCQPALRQQDNRVILLRAETGQVGLCAPKAQEVKRTCLWKSISPGASQKPPQWEAVQLRVERGSKKTAF